MARRLLLLAIAASVGAAPLCAQKPPPPAAHPTTQPAQTPATSKTAGKVFRPAAAHPAAPATQPAAPAAQPAAPASQVTPQAAHPSTNAFTAGLAMPAYTGSTPAAALDYAARFGRMLDSAIVTLVELFRNTSGEAMAGAGDPSALSQRERDRWSRCRNVYWDLTTFASAMEPLRQALPANPGLQQAAAELDAAFAASQAVAECDNVASMIAAPDRWTHWSDQYQTAAQRFYRDFYAQVREVHEHDRTFVNELNTVLPAGRHVAVPPGLPHNPPYAGAGPGE